MNPWHDKIGCEVNVCKATLCDEERMKICALRKNYQWRVQGLVLKLKRLNGSRYKAKVIQEIKGLGDYACLQANAANATYASKQK